MTLTVHRNPSQDPQHGMWKTNLLKGVNSISHLLILPTLVSHAVLGDTPKTRLEQIKKYLASLSPLCQASAEGSPMLSHGSTKKVGALETLEATISIGFGCSKRRQEAKKATMQVCTVLHSSQLCSSTDAGLETLVQILGKSGAKAAKAKATKVEIVQIQHETLWIRDSRHGTSAQHRDLQGSRKTVNKLLESDPTP